MTERVAGVEPEHWGEDPKLVELLGGRGAVEFRALLDGFPDAVGVLWALRDAGGRIVDFAFGYGNPAMLRAFRLPAATRERYTLLEALPRMRGSRAFDAYVRVCESGESWVREVTYDTPFGDGYMLGTFMNRTAKLGDGVVNFLTDVTEQRRMEAELRNYAHVVAHDLNEPVADTVRGLLDGHIVLSRELAHRNHYPAVDVLASVSRLMPMIATPEHRQAAGKIRDLIATYQHSEDLISIGAYVPGNNPRLDLAVSLKGEIDALLKQDIDENAPFEETLERLQAIAARIPD